MSLVANELIQQVCGVTPGCDLEIEVLGLLDYTGPGRLLSFLDDPKYLSQASSNPNLCAILVTEHMANELKKYNSSAVMLVVDDPRWCFYSLYNEVARYRNKEDHPTIVHPTAMVSQSAYIEEKNVTIGARTVIEPGAVILGPAIIGENCIIRAGAIIGASGFEHKRTSKGILSVTHDGRVRIANEVEIGAGTNVAKGFHGRDTVIGDQTKVDALVHIAHAVSIGARCLIAAQAVLCGSVIVGDDVWIGPSVTISNGLKVGNGAFITIGSCVVRDVREGERVTGYFAIPHTEFLIRMAKSAKTRPNQGSF
jgi:UDP-3-O-[3-hydroxymyristoyl] glucosamine N-acyltransferase